MDIKKRILQILEEKEPISFDLLAEEIKNRALSEDYFELSMDRIYSKITEEIKKSTIFKTSKDLLYIHNPKNVFMVYKEEAFTIRYNPTGEELIIGSPGMTVNGGYSMYGDFKNVENTPDKYYFALNIDLPLRLELDEKLSDPYAIKFNEIEYQLFHKIKKRGEEDFSTLNTDRLPHFSSIQIVGSNTEEDKYNLVLYILQKLNVALNNDILKKIIFKENELPYSIYYMQKSDNQQAAYSIHWATGDVKILGKNIDNAYPEDELRKIFNSANFELQNYIDNKKQNYESIQDFDGKLFALVHDFAYYGRQHPEGIGRLGEELIRDLFIIAVKTGLSNICEAEAFNYDGKADFKITNPQNKYEFYIGEFKWWTGEASIKELCMQAFEKHVTGQEKKIYLIMLNKNKDINNPRTKSLEYIKSNSFITSDAEKISPEGSKEHFYKFTSKIKQEDVDIVFGIMNLYHEKITI